MRDPLDTSIGSAPFYSVAENKDNRNGVSEPAVSHGRISQLKQLAHSRTSAELHKMNI